MARLYLSLVDSCRRNVDEWNNQTPTVQRCQHGYVMALQQRFEDLPQAQGFAAAPMESPKWANAAVLQDGEAEVEQMAQARVMSSPLSKILRDITKAVDADEESQS